MKSPRLHVCSSWLTSKIDNMSTSFLNSSLTWKYGAKVAAKNSLILKYICFCRPISPCRKCTSPWTPEPVYRHKPMAIPGDGVKKPLPKYLRAPTVLCSYWVHHHEIWVWTFTRTLQTTRRLSVLKFSEKWQVVPHLFVAADWGFHCELTISRTRRVGWVWLCYPIRHQTLCRLSSLTIWRKDTYHCRKISTNWFATFIASARSPSCHAFQ